MLIDFLKWVFRKLVPYLFGIGSGIGFFFILIQFVPGTPELRQSRLAFRGDTPPGSRGLVHQPPSGSGTTVAQVVSKPSPPRVEELAAAETLPESPGFPVIVPVSPQAKPVTSVPSPSVAIKSPDAALPESHGQRAGSQPVANAISSGKKQGPRKTQGDCGVPVLRLGPERDRYFRCRWRQDCLNRMERARSMIAQEEKRCPKSGINSGACHAYYRSLEQRYHPALCRSGPVGW